MSKNLKDKLKMLPLIASRTVCAGVYHLTCLLVVICGCVHHFLIVVRNRYLYPLKAGDADIFIIDCLFHFLGSDCQIHGKMAAFGGFGTSHHYSPVSVPNMCSYALAPLTLENVQSFKLQLCLLNIFSWFHNVSINLLYQIRYLLNHL